MPAQPHHEKPAQTPGQERARDALGKVNAICKENFAGEYCSYVEALPAAVVMNGLGQAVATLRANANGENPRNIACDRLYKHLSDWLCGSSLAPYSGSGDLLDAITSKGQNQYLLAQAEALAYLEWLKKFAVAFIEKTEKTK